MTALSNVEESLEERPRTHAAGEVVWLAEGEIPKAAVTLLSGEPGSGKSFVACSLAASVSQVRGARVVFVHTEPAERLHARLARAGADAGRIALLGDRGQGTGNSKGFAQRLDVLIAWLTGAASNASRVDLIVLDDLESLLGKALCAGELAEAAARLNELARTSGAAVLAVVRSATTIDGRVTARALDRLMRAAEVVWMVAADRDTSGRRWLAPLKNNLASLPGGKTFQIAEGRVEWLTGAVPNDALNPGSRRSVERADRQTAGQWLFEALRDRDVHSRVLYAQAKQCGFSRNAILRAAHQMGMHSHKSAFDGGWMYSLRDALPEAVARFRPQPRAFGGQGTEAGEGFKIAEGGGGQRPEAGEQGDSEGFGIQDSGFSEPQAASEPEKAENRSKSPKGLNTVYQSPNANPCVQPSVPSSRPRGGFNSIAKGIE